MMSQNLTLVLGDNNSLVSAKNSFNAIFWPFAFFGAVYQLMARVHIS
jgi:hypothetical protein